MPQQEIREGISLGRRQAREALATRPGASGAKGAVVGAQLNGKAAVGSGNAEFISRLQNARLDRVPPVDLREVVGELNVIGREIDACAPIGQPCISAKGNGR